MFCGQCGSPVKEGQSFCGQCGAKVITLEEDITKDSSQESNVEMQMDWEPIVDDTIKTKSPSINTHIVLQIVAGICVAICLGNFFASTIGGAKSVLDAMRIDGYGVVPMLGNILRVVQGVIFAATTAVLVLLVTPKDKNETETIFVVLAECGLVATAIVFIRLFLSVITMISMKYSFFPEELFRVLVLYIFIIGAIYGVLYLMGNIPLAGKWNVNDLKEMAIQSPKDILEIFKTFGGQVSEKAKSAYSSDHVQRNNVDQVQTIGSANTDAQTGTALAVRNNATSAPHFPKRRLRTDRGLFVYILLSLLTCGIYSIFFTYSLVKDINTACAGDREHTHGLLVTSLLTTLTCGIYGYIWYYKVGNRLQKNAMRYGVMVPENGTTILMWLVLGSALFGIGPFVALNIIIKNTNLVCDLYNKDNMKQQA